MNPLLIILGVIGGIFALVVFGLAFNIIGLWFQSVVSGAKSGLFDLIMMRFRKVNPRVIVVNRITAKKAGIDIPTDWLEAHFLAGGRVGNVVLAMIAAEKAGIDLAWDRATAIDLAGRDILDAVRASVDPRVIDCPNPEVGKATIDAVAMDGIQLKARARVTVRTNIDRLVGGATEETIIARVGEGIVSAIGSAVTHKEVLENPDRISKAVLGKGLDTGTAFEILSIDIADIDVGQNIGAHLRNEQAEADKKMFQAEAEKRRALAVAHAAEHSADVEKNRALVVLAEADVPKAMAEALKNGNLGAMDWYRMQNIDSDTRMRSSIAGDASGGSESGQES